MYKILQKIKAKDCIDIKLNNQLYIYIYIYIYIIDFFEKLTNALNYIYINLTLYSKIYFHDFRSYKRLIPRVGLILVPILT